MIDRSDAKLIVQMGIWAMLGILAIVVLSLSAGLAIRLFLWAAFA